MFWPQNGPFACLAGRRQVGPSQEQALLGARGESSLALPPASLFCRGQSHRRCQNNVPNIWENVVHSPMPAGGAPGT